MTGQNLIDASGRLLGELRADRTFGPNESAQLLVSLNNMLGLWSEGQWAIHQITRETLPLTGVASYTFGLPGGSLASPRPVRIERVATLNATSVRLPGRVVTAEQWTIENPDDTATGDFVDMLWPDYGSPLCTMRVYPRAAATSTLELYSLKPLTAVALAVEVTLPPGYDEAIVYNFACQIAPEFNKQPSAEVGRIAESSRAAITTMNMQLYPAPAAKAAA